MRTAAVVAALVALGLPALAQESDSIPISTGVFTQQQADRGEDRYRAMCTRCHGRELIAAITEVPSLTSFAFAVNWTGKTVADLFNKIRYTMPAIDRPTMPFEHANEQDYLDEQLTADLVAYILSFNGYPAGESELAPDTAVLERIVVTPPAKAMP